MSEAIGSSSVAKTVVALGQSPQMPAVERPDGVELHWEQQGRGPLVLIAHQILWSFPGVYERLIGDLASDHRVVTYDARGCGASTRRGPYGTETDAADLLAVVEAAGGQAVALAVGYGYNLAVRVAAARPDAIGDVVCVQPAAAAVLPRTELRGTDVMAASESVMAALMQLMRTDPRAAVRTLLAVVNPELGEAHLRERVARVWKYVSPEAMIERTRVWLEDDPSEQARALGDRLRILHGGTEPLFEGALKGHVAKLYPDAALEELPGGPITRPDLFAARVRRVTGVKAS
jgi:pimeloyl-ACP methyl ester carboxylesterase